LATRSNRGKQEETPFQRFKDFAQRLLAVPKSEIDEREKAAKRPRKKPSSS